jgi:nifR3 family TIM-barrel protein
MNFPKLNSKAILAPMSGVTDIAFRELCREYGAGLTYTEFVSSAAIVRSNERTFDMIKLSPLEKPSAVQLFGGNIKEVVKAARILSEKGFDIIDINCGCPAYKVIKQDAGSELLKKPAKIAELVSLMVKKVDAAITVKIRTGIDKDSINAIKVAKIAGKAGASAITIHGRTQKQGYTGVADWNLIKQVKESVNIPVIGNGDIFKPQDFKKKLKESGVDYIMIGRAAMTNPYLFRQIKDYTELDVFEWADKKKIFFEYVKKAENYKINYAQVKNHALSFTKGLVGGSEFRIGLGKCKSIAEVKDYMKKL